MMGDSHGGESGGTPSAGTVGDWWFGGVRCSHHTIPDLLAEIRALLADRALRPRIINCLNAHIFNLAMKQASLRENLNASRVVAADGIGVVIASRLLGHPLRARCNMTEAFRAFLTQDHLPACRAVLVGASREDAERAASRISQIACRCRIVQSFSGYEDNAAYLRALSIQPEPDLVLVGMGTPRSEAFARMAADVCPGAIIWHIGGGTIHFLSGSVREAPGWMRQWGLQWLHRLLMEPGRMWRRYAIGNVLFIARVVRLLVMSDRSGAAETSMPSGPGSGRDHG